MCTTKARSGTDAFLKFKCPRCRRGKMFTHPFYNLRKFQEMRSHCNVCGVNFEPETGFYWGAMYISYALSVALCVTLALGIRLLFGPGLDINIYIITIIGVMILFAPLSFRLSRAIMLHRLARIKYDPDFQWDGTLLDDEGRLN